MLILCIYILCLSLALGSVTCIDGCPHHLFVVIVIILYNKCCEAIHSWMHNWPLLTILRDGHWSTPPIYITVILKLYQPNLIIIFQLGGHLGKLNQCSLAQSDGILVWRTDCHLIPCSQSEYWSGFLQSTYWKQRQH